MPESSTITPPAPPAPPDTQPLVRIRGLTKHYPIRKGVFNRLVGQVRAVDGVDLDIRPGECLGLVGESGSGKTTVGRCMLRAVQPTAGEVTLNLHGRQTELTTAPASTLRELRRHLQMIFQDPFSSLNPRLTVSELVGEPMQAHGIPRRQRQDRAADLIERVGLRREHLDRYPHAFSGGQRQRIGIARALALQPSLIVADEPVSALDLSVQAQVLNLLADLQHEFQLTYLFIAHDLSVVRHVCDRVAVMYRGKIVELADVDELFNHPRHPYTERLLAAMPVTSPHQRRGSRISGAQGADEDEGEEKTSTPSPTPAKVAPSVGCNYTPKCPYRQEVCKQQTPPLEPVAGDQRHRAACHFAQELDLKGIADAKGSQS